MPCYLYIWKGGAYPPSYEWIDINWPHEGVNNLNLPLNYLKMWGHTPNIDNIKTPIKNPSWHHHHHKFTFSRTFLT